MCRRRTGRYPAPLLLLFLLAAGSMASCARTVPPRGGDIPETPLQIVATSPDTFAVVDPFEGPIRFEFDRRVSERPTSGQLRDVVVVSPRSGEVSVGHDRRGIEVRMEGGFRARTVYRVTLLPSIQDLWRNPLAGPYDLFFSTGPEFEPNVLGGVVTDRLTGDDVPEMRVDAVPVEEGPTHSTVTDTTGIFTFPYLPAGEYHVRAYEDFNRNYEPNFSERQDSTAVDVALGDTLVVEMALLLPDTTPAVLTAAEPVDSTTLRLEFDDPIGPDEPLGGVEVTVERPDGPAPAVTELLHPHEWEARAPVVEPVEEDVDQQVQQQQQEEEEEETEVVAEETPQEAPDPRPGTQLYVLLDAPLEPGVAYEVSVQGITNLNGLPGGGGDQVFEGPQPPDPPDDPDGEQGGDGAGDGGDGQDDDTDDDGGGADGRAGSGGLVRTDGLARPASPANTDRLDP